MIEGPQQLQLFASFAPNSVCEGPNSPHSSAQATSSSAPSSTNRGDAIATTQTRHARATSLCGGAESAATRPSSVAKNTAASVRQLPLWTSTKPPNTEASMLTIPRPKTLADCGQEARPCPWVACRHHLALEVASPNVQVRKDPRATTIRLNMPRRGRVREGRRPGLASSDAAAVVRVWIDEATELLSRMPYTCTFDVVRDYPDGLPSWMVARMLGVTEQAIDKELRRSVLMYRNQLLTIHADVDANMLESQL